MKSDHELSKAIEQMRCGSREGFLTFFNKTFQFSYLWTLHAFHNATERNEFLAEFYPYLLLHIAELKNNEDVLPWIQSALPDFFERMTGRSYIRLPLAPSDVPQESEMLSAATIVWSMIVGHVSFPSAPKRQSLIFPIVFIGSCAILLLLIGLLNYEKKQTQNSEIDKINEENQIYSSDSELESFLNGTAPNALSDSVPSTEGSVTTVTNIDNSANARGTVTHNTETPMPPSVDTPSVSEPSVDTPTVSEPSAPSVEDPQNNHETSSVPHADIPAVTAPTVTEPSITAPSVTEPSSTPPSVHTPQADNPSQN